MEEEQEIQKSIELADLVKPQMEDGFDLTLFTQTEIELMKKLAKDHKRIFRERAEELRFYPDTLNRKERAAILRCLTYEELKPYYRTLAIEEKNIRLQKLRGHNKVEIRRYTRMTVQFSKVSCDDEKDLPDRSIADITEKYFSIMSENEEKAYEDPFYFLNEAHKEQVLKKYSPSMVTNSIDATPKELGDQITVKAEVRAEQ